MVQYFYIIARKRIMRLTVLLSAILLTGVGANPSPDIVGGTDATIAEFPSMVFYAKHNKIY